MITAILRDKRGFEIKIRIPEVKPSWKIPLPITPMVSFSVGKNGYTTPNGVENREQEFFFEKMLKPRTALYKEQ